MVIVCGLLAAACGDDTVGGNTGGTGGTAGSGGSGGAGGSGGTGGSGGGLGNNNCTPPSSVTLSPATTTANVMPGGTFMQAFTATAGGTDVTAQTFFSVDDPTAGTFNGATFNWSATRGGVITVTGTYCGVAGTATITLNLSGGIGTGTIDPGTASGMFNTGGTSTMPACKPTLIYPPDGVLLPPNTNVIEIHFDRGTPNNNLFEISFANSVTDIRIYTACTGTTPAEGLPTGNGCIFELDQQEWDFVARSNADGDPVAVKVRGLGCDGSNVASSDTRNISFAREDLVGTLYYWASVRLAGTGSVFSGGVYRYDFGVRGQSPEAVLTPTMTTGPNTGHLCIGCHDVSRDGRMMVFDYDDNDADDEYGDIYTDLFDIATQAVAKPIVKDNNQNGAARPGFHSWNRETTHFMLSDGPGNDSASQVPAQPDGAFARVHFTETGSTLSVNVANYTRPGTLRGTTPDWAPDDSAVVFASPPNVKVTPPAAGYWMNKQGPKDDLWFAGASLYVSTYDPVSSMLGSPTMIAMSNGTDNFYYPSFSPDGSLIAFDHAASGPNFHNSLARVELVVAGQSNPTPVDLMQANTPDAVTNSWPRWSPFVQRYKGGHIVWMTFSSTRDYGLRIGNAGKVNCYPTESPITPFFTQPPTAGCTRTQIWMTAIKLDSTMVGSGVDVSKPAFWLPFQDLTTNNHLAQWAQRGLSGTCTSNTDCGTGRCCFAGACGSCPPPPQPMCTQNINCPQNQCCSNGQCVACNQPPPDGGTGGCNTCLDCNGQACNGGMCGACTNSSQCCAPLLCNTQTGQCVVP